MTEDDIGQFIYLALLGCAVGGWVFTQGRKNISKTIQYAAIWGFLFLGVIAVYGLWDDIKGSTLNLPAISDDGAIRITRSADGHFYLPALVNGKSITFMVDTGASNIVLNRAAAKRAGIDWDSLRFTGIAYTANGPTATASVRLESLAIGPIKYENVRVVVNEGDLFDPLLGMDFLGNYNIQMTQDTLIIAP